MQSPSISFCNHTLGEAPPIFYVTTLFTCASPVLLYFCFSLSLPAIVLYVFFAFERTPLCIKTTCKRHLFLSLSVLTNLSLVDAMHRYMCALNGCLIFYSPTPASTPSACEGDQPAHPTANEPSLPLFILIDKHKSDRHSGHRCLLASQNRLAWV